MLEIYQLYYKIEFINLRGGHGEARGRCEAEQKEGRVMTTKEKTEKTVGAGWWLQIAGCRFRVPCSVSLFRIQHLGPKFLIFHFPFSIFNGSPGQQRGGGWGLGAGAGWCGGACAGESFSVGRGTLI